MLESDIDAREPDPCSAGHWWKGFTDWNEADNSTEYWRCCKRCGLVQPTNVSGDTLEGEEE